MQHLSHQTVRLAKGRHTSPDRGVCVMELASMLAGEAFTDHPRSVAPSIAAFLRGYNDIVDDARRQDLYRYAADAIGTAGSITDERVRSQRLRAWTREMSGQRRRWTISDWRRSRRRRHDHNENPQTSALHAIHTIRRVSDETHAAVLALVDELLAIRTPSPKLEGQLRSSTAVVASCAAPASVGSPSAAEDIVAPI